MSAHTQGPLWKFPSSAQADAPVATDMRAVCEAAVTEYELAKRAGFEPRMLVCLERIAHLARAALAKVSP